MTLSQSDNAAIQWVGPAYISQKIIATLQHMADRPDVKRIVAEHEKQIEDRKGENLEQ